MMGVGVAPFPLNVLVFVGGNIFVICFETLICFIQTLRLHVYEYFSKFYEGAGEEFLPFEVMRKYTFLPSLNMGKKQ
jgi:V/A-type H+-transporting ATPase subunit I